MTLNYIDNQENGNQEHIKDFELTVWQNFKSWSILLGTTGLLKYLVMVVKITLKAVKMKINDFTYTCSRF